jgi:hypothetical protein
LQEHGGWGHIELGVQGDQPVHQSPWHGTAAGLDVLLQCHECGIGVVGLAQPVDEGELCGGQEESRG